MWLRYYFLKVLIRLVEALLALTKVMMWLPLLVRRHMLRFHINLLAEYKSMAVRRIGKTRALSPQEITEILSRLGLVGLGKSSSHTYVAVPRKGLESLTTHLQALETLETALEHTPIVSLDTKELLPPSQTSKSIIIPRAEA